MVVAAVAVGGGERTGAHTQTRDHDDKKFKTISSKKRPPHIVRQEEQE